MLTPLRLHPAFRFALFPFLLAACAGTHPRDPGGDGREFAGRTLAVLMPEASATGLSGNADLAASLRAAFPGAATESAGAVLARAFGDAFWSGLVPSLAHVVAARVPDSLPAAPPDRRIRLPRADGDSSGPQAVLAAPDSAWLAEHGLAADLILALGPLSASSTSEERNAYRFGGSIRVTTLNLEGEYLLWDYPGRRPLARGRFRSRTGYRFSPETGDWTRIFGQAARSVADAMPFKRPPKRRLRIFPWDS